MQNVEFCKSLVVSTLAIIYKSHFTKGLLFLLKKGFKTGIFTFFIFSCKGSAFLANTQEKSAVCS